MERHLLFAFPISRFIESLCRNPLRRPLAQQPRRRRKGKGRQGNPLHLMDKKRQEHNPANELGLTARSYICQKNYLCSQEERTPPSKSESYVVVFVPPSLLSFQHFGVLPLRQQTIANANTISLNESPQVLASGKSSRLHVGKSKRHRLFDPKELTPHLTDCTCKINWLGILIIHPEMVNLPFSCLSVWVLLV